MPIQHNALANKIVTIPPESPNYPASVKNSIKKPPTLYSLGNLKLLTHENKLAVIGSRRLSSQNLHSIDHVLSELQGAPLCIISGLALGIDARAHEIALRNEMPTIAILGSSVEPHEWYPPSNRKLAERILQANGLLLSPFPSKAPLYPSNFPARNQIIASLSSATLVVSAAVKSGALITAKFALDYGRDVLIIPGPVGNALFEGSNKMLQEGAEPILASENLLAHFGLTTRSRTRHYEPSNPTEAHILTRLNEGDCTLELLAHKTQLNTPQINALISELELRGWVSVNDNGTIQLQ